MASQKISSFNVSTSLTGNDLFTFVLNGTNKNVKFSDFKLALGVTGTLEAVGDPLATPVLNKIGDTNQIRNLESGAGILASVSPENGISLKWNVDQDSEGVPITSGLTNDQPVISSLVAGTGISISKSDDAIEFSVTTDPSTGLANRVVVSEAADLSGTLDSMKEYFIDGIINMGSQTIEVPSGGLNLTGYNFNTSKLISNAAGYTMFFSPVGGSGDVIGKDYAIEVTGASSQVYELKSATGFDAFEFTRVNYNDCSSLGSIDNYRQGLEIGTGRFGGKPQLKLFGTWLGGYFIDTSIVRNLDDGDYSLFSGSPPATYVLDASTGVDLIPQFVEETTTQTAQEAYTAWAAEIGVSDTVSLAGTTTGDDGSIEFVTTLPALPNGSFSAMQNTEAGLFFYLTQRDHNTGNQLETITGGTPEQGFSMRSFSNTPNNPSMAFIFKNPITDCKCYAAKWQEDGNNIIASYQFSKFNDELTDNIDVSIRIKPDTNEFEVVISGLTQSDNLFQVMTFNETETTRVATANQNGQAFTLTSGTNYKYIASSIEDGFVMNSRFRSNQNIDLPANVSFLDFFPASFVNPSTLQLDGCLITRDGITNAADTNIIPNASSSDLVSEWMGNNGIDNTFVGAETNVTAEIVTTIVSDGVYVDLAGTFTIVELTHFDSPSNGQLRHIGDSPREYQLGGQFVIDGTANDVVAIKATVFRSATSLFEDGKIQTRVVNALQGGRNVAYYVYFDNITLNKNDYVKFQVANIGSTDDVTVELDSSFSVQAR